MDRRQTEQPEATASTSSSFEHVSTPSAQSVQPPTSSTPARKPVRSSARVRAAKERELDKEKARTLESAAPEPSASSSAASSAESSSSGRVTRATSTLAKRTRDTKGKGKEVSDQPPLPKTSRVPAQSASGPLSISEPRDLKGKKRAALESISDSEDVSATSSASNKRPRSGNTSYSLRTREVPPPPPAMPRKAKTSPTKTKTSRSKGAMTASSSRDEEDVHMQEADYVPVRPDSCMDPDLPPAQPAPPEAEINALLDDGEEGRDDSEDEHPGGPPRGGAQDSDGTTMDEAAAMSALFGADFRAFGSYMLGQTTRLKSLLNNIKMTEDPTTRLLALQELSELLSMSTEDTLAGFPMEPYIRELIRILGGSGNSEDDENEGDGDEDMQDEDAALAAALAMSNGGKVYIGDENPEAQVLACRCLANLMEALPGVAHTIVYHGSLPVLCSKLLEISYIDLAEQTLITLEKISEEFPSSIVREGGLGALLNYLDFFSIAVQRTALQTASNCCRGISTEHFPMLQGVWSIIRRCLSYSDQRLVEHACHCVIRVVDSYYRSNVGHLEALIDTELIKAIHMLLLPAGGSSLVTANTFTLLLRALATCARVSAKISLTLLEADVVDILYQILTGVLPSASGSHEDQGNAASGQGLGGGLADMTVMENLAHKPKDQIEEALSLVSELMPPMPKDGVFDHKAYTEKSHARMIKAKFKAEKVSAIPALPGDVAVAESAPPTDVVNESSAEAMSPPASGETPSAHIEAFANAISSRDAASASHRTELLRGKSAVVGRFMVLIVPVLIDVYAASVIVSVRIKTLTSALKAVNFLDQDGLRHVLNLVPIAGFASSILSSKDHPSLVIGSLQVVELLLVKLPEEYKPAFRREGVFHEIQALASRTVSSKGKDKSKDKDKEAETSSSPPPVDSSQPVSASLAATIHGYKKLVSMSLDPEDAITFRARVIQFKYMNDDTSTGLNSTLEALQRLQAVISSSAASEEQLTCALKELVSLFRSDDNAVSSFELLQSGAVDSLMSMATSKDATVDLIRRQRLLFDTFSERFDNTNEQSALGVLVKKLQEALTRIEAYDVVTVSQGVDDSRRSSPSLLARQLRLRLVAEEGADIPKNLNNIVVSIHAIATFQALHDYLRPRVSGVMSGATRLSTMLAALAASAGASGSSSRAALADVGQPRLSSSIPVPELPATTSSASQAPVRRRSQRLREKKSGNVETSVDSSIPALASGSIDAHSAGNASDPSVSSDAPADHSEAPRSSISGFATSQVAPSDTLVDDERADAFETSFTDEDVDAEVFDDDEDPDASMSENTISVNVTEDGSRVEAQTPGGTGIGTPTPARTSPLAARSASAGKASYAAALKAKPTDWHLEFEMDGNALPLDLTIYGAIHQHQIRKTKNSSVSPSLIWQGVHTVKFKKVAGPARSPEGREDGLSRSRSASPSLSSLPHDAPHTKILRLLRVLHRVNIAESEYTGRAPFLPETAFVNNKLTAKLTRQLEEPMIVASSCLPDWALDMPQNFPFLFPFATRYNFLQSTSFGYARLILKWQSQQGRGQDNSRRDDSIAFLGRLQRQKVRISRKHILESAIKVFEMYGSSSSVLEVEYFEEVGTGLGPTLEFYSLASREFARRNLKLWRDEDATRTGLYVHHPRGLFPAPLEEVAGEDQLKRTHLFKVVGQFVAKAMLDSRIIDMSFNKIFLKLVLGEEVPLTIDTLKLVDPELAASLSKLSDMSSLATSEAQTPALKVEDLALDFTLPGYDVELRSGGKEVVVTAENVSEYVHEVLDAILGKGAVEQTRAFREGFSKVFSVDDLQAFSADELVMLFGNSDEDWTIETIGEALKADHGFNIESRAIRDLIEIMVEYDVPTRRAYLQFITGSPKLPIGGFRGLNPPLTVVRKPHEAPLTANDYLPSVMTCVNYLKLPEYSNKAVMREKLSTAMKEGVGSFHLS